MTYHDEFLACRDYILNALSKKMMERSDQPYEVWTAAERMTVAVAANTWAEAYKLSRHVTVHDVERVEQMAVGHVDYGRKLALYVAELIYYPESRTATP